MLKVEQLDVAYGDIQVLHGISFEVSAGEVVCLLGANGVGKTTTLRAISGFLASHRGEITFRDQPIRNLSTDQIVDLGIAQVPEGRHLFPTMTVRENLELGSFTRRAKASRKQTLEWVFGLFPRLAERESQLAGTLSGGEQQMVAIGRALMSKPELLMLDEPSLGLAPVVVQAVFRTIQQLRDEGLTILLVEQNVFQALNISGRGYVLEGGTISMAGPAQELKDNPHIRRAYLGM